MRRRILIIGVLAALLSATYLLWFRDSALVAVEKVTVTGATGRDAERIRTALEGAGRQMTTLHVDERRLAEAALAFPAVRTIEVSADFPSGLSVQVIEHRPAALVTAGGRQVLVAGDGSVLPGQSAQGSVPEVELEGKVAGDRLAPGPALDAVRVAGAAPSPLLGKLEDVRRDGEEGIVATLEDGPRLIFGDTDRIAAKWAAAARVLADKDAAGAEYVDLRIPERPAAGGLPVETLAPVAPAGAAEPLADPGSEAGEPLAETPPVEPAAPATPPEQVAPADPVPVPVEPAPEAPPVTGGGAGAYPQP